MRPAPADDRSGPFTTRPMTVDQAAKILEAPAGATPEQLELRFNEQRARLEDRIAKAPTPGLKEKYRRSLEELTLAFETLVLAADAGNLPVLEHLASGHAASAPVARRAAGPDAAEKSAVATAPAPRAEPAAPRPPARKSSGHSREFLIVAVIAVLALAGGGWFVMKTRAEKAERARVAAEEARIAAEVKAKAEADRLAKEAEDKAEQDRLAQVATLQRTLLAEARVEWDARESELRDAERRVTELKSELRGARDLPAPKKAELSAEAAKNELFTEWLKAVLLRHPAKIARAKAEQFLDAKSPDEAAVAVKEMREALGELASQVDARRRELLQSTGQIAIDSTPAGLGFVFTDSYGRVTEGKTPGRISNVPLTHVQKPTLDGSTGPIVKLGEFTAELVRVRFVRLGWEDVEGSRRVDSTALIRFRHDSPQGALKIESLPAGVPWQASNVRGWTAKGVTPATLTVVPPGTVKVRLARPGYKDVEGTAEIYEGHTAALTLDQRPQHVLISVAEPDAEIWVDGKLQGKKEVTLTTHAPGSHQLELRHPKFSRYRTPIEIKQEFTKRTYQFSFAKLSGQTETCTACKGQGFFNRAETCNTCRGSNRVRCQWCEGKRGRNTINIMTGAVTGWINCEQCKGRGTEECGVFQCDRGTYRWTDKCTTCSGDGRRSKLELAQ